MGVKHQGLVDAVDRRHHGRLTGVKDGRPHSDECATCALLTDLTVAKADADYVLRWLLQTNAPDNILGLQARVLETLSS